MNNQRINYTVGFTADTSGLNTVRKSLQDITKLGTTEFKLNTGKGQEELEALKRSANQVQDALTKAFNVNLNTLDLKVFKQEVDKIDGGMAGLAKSMNSAGTAGKAAFSDILSTVLTTQSAMKQTNKVLDSMGKTFFNTIKWGLSSSIINMFTRSIQNAWNYTKQLDESLNNIRIVTGKSAEDMEKFAKEANKAAKALGSTTTSYTNASLIYYQQGLGEKDVQARTKTTIKAANVTGQSAAEVSEQLTAVWNGYKVVAEEAELYVDKLAAVAATTAADLEELSTGMSKVASAANAMGVDVDQLSAQLATIVSVTRQDASVVGTALKTIFSRMGDLKVDGVDEFGVSLGDVSGQLAQMGIQVLDQQGNLRDMGKVIEEVAEKWGTWTDAQQQAAAVAIAGKRQYNNLIALFENWDMYESALSTSQNSEGTLQKQQDTYMDSIEARLTELKAASEGLFDSLIDSESTKDLISVFTKMVEVIDQLAQALGGLGNILTLAAGLATKMFSGQITQGIGQMYTNRQNSKFNNSQNAAAAELGFSADKADLTTGQQTAVDLKAEQIRLEGLLSEEEKKHYNVLIKQTLELEKQQNLKRDELGGLKGTAKDIAGQMKGAPKPNKIENYSPEQLQTFFTDASEQSRTAFTAASQPIAQNTSKKTRRDQLKAIKNAPMTESTQLQMNELNNSTAYNGVLKKVKKGQTLHTDEIGKYNEYLSKSAILLSENTAELEKYAQTTQKNTQDVKALSAAEQAAAQDRERIAKAAAFKTLTNQITNMIGTITMGVAAFQSLSNAFAILNNDTLTEEERITQFSMAILSAVAIILPTVMGAIGTLKAGAVGLQAAFGWITIVMYAIIAIAGVVYGLIKFFKKDTPSALEVAQKHFDSLNESLASMKDRVKELRKGYAELKSELKDYRDAKHGIDELRAGTEEWKDAVDALNLQVLSLIEKYPELKLIETKLADGSTLYEIDEKSVDAVLKSYKDGIANSELITSNLELRRAFAQRDVTKEKGTGDVKKELEETFVPLITTVANNRDKTQLDDREALLTNLAGSDNISFISGGYVSDGDMLYHSRVENVKLDSLFERSTEDLIKLEQQIKNSNVLSEQESSIILEAIAAIKEHKGALEENTNLIMGQQGEAYLRAVAKAMGIDPDVFVKLANKEKTFKNDIGVAKDIEGDSVDYDNSEERGDFIRNNSKKDETLTYVKFNDDGSIATDANGDIITYKPDDGDNGRIGDEINNIGDIQQVDAWIDNLAKAAYGPDVVVNSHGKKDGVSIAEIGTIVVKINGQEMTIEELQAAVFNAAWRQKIERENNELIDYQKQLQTEGKSADAALFGSGYFTGADSVSKSWSEGALAKYNKIISYGGVEGENARATRDTFWNEMVGYLNSAGLDSSNSDIYSLLTGGQIKGLSNSISSAKTFGGGEAIKNLLNSITDPYKMQQVASLLEDANWSSTEWVTNFQSKLLDLGIDIEDDKWAGFFDAVNSGMKQWVESAEKVRENLAFIKNTIKDLKIGDIISDEDYKKLLSIDPNAKNSFIRGADGWVATTSGKTLAKSATSKYQDLGKTKQTFSTIKTQVASATEAGVLAGEGSGLSEIRELANYFGFGVTFDENGSMEFLYANSNRTEALLSLLGIDFTNFTDLLYSLNDPNKKEGALAQLQTLAQKADQMMIDASQGYYDEKAAIDTFVTSGVSVSQAVGSVDSLVYKDDKGSTQSVFTDQHLTYFANELFAEIQEVSSTYKEFLISEKEFWDLEMKDWSTMTASSLLSNPTVSSQIGAIATKADATMGAYESIIDGLFVTDPENNPENYVELYQSAQKELLNYKDLIAESEDLWMNTIDQLMESYDKQIERFTTFNSILSSTADLVKLVGYNIENSSETLAGYYDLMQTNAERAYSGSKEKYEKALEQYNAMLADTSGAYSHAMKEKITETYESATEEFLSASSEWVETIQTAFSGKVSAAIASVIRSATGYGRDDLSQAWELEKTKDERYLDDVNKAYAINNFERNVQKSIDSASSLSVQKRLNDLKERELKILAEKGKLTQYDLDRANAEYELELKRIALEEAQQTANKMKLVRDANGNYSYQYVADQDAIAKAEEELAAAQNNLYNLDKDRKKELIDEWFSAMTEYEERMAEAMATGNEELQQQVQDYYFGANGLLTSLQSELQLLGLNDNFSATANKILQVKVTGEDGLEGQLTSIISSTKEAMAEATSEIQGLFDEDGTLTVAMDTLSDSADLAGEALKALSNEDGTGAADLLVSGLNTLTQNIVTYTERLKTALGNLDPYKDAADTIAQDSKDALDENTQALMLLTAVAQDMVDGSIDGRDHETRLVQIGDAKWDGDMWIIANDTGNT